LATLTGILFVDFLVPVVQGNDSLFEFFACH